MSQQTFTEYKNIIQQYVDTFYHLKSHRQQKCHSKHLQNTRI